MNFLKRKTFKWTMNDEFIIDHERDRNIVWESTGGKKTTIMDMNINHLRNVISKMEKGQYSKNIRSFIQPILKTELIYRDIQINNNKNKK
jgi:hypothetical protein